MRPARSVLVPGNGIATMTSGSCHKDQQRMTCLGLRVQIKSTAIAQDPPYDDKSFAKIVTRDASLEAGSAAACVPNMRKGWQVLINAGDSESGRKLITEATHMCPQSAVESKEDAKALAEWLQNAWDYLAMVSSI